MLSGTVLSSFQGIFYLENLNTCSDLEGSIYVSLWFHNIYVELRAVEEGENVLGHLV